MELQHERCAGMDISKRDVKVCVRTPGKRHRTFDKHISVWGATAGEVAELAQFLIAQQVTLVVMEATGNYWKPFYYPMEADLNVSHRGPVNGRRRSYMGSEDLEWVRVADDADITEDAAISCDVAGLAACLTRSGGRIYAIRDQRTHQDVPLSEGDVEDGAVECFMQGSRFDLATGRVLNPPAVETSHRPAPGRGFGRIHGSAGTALTWRTLSPAGWPGVAPEEGGRGGS